MNWLALVLSTVSAIVLGLLWYAPWSPTGKAWARAVRRDPSAPAHPWLTLRGGITAVVGTLLMMFVFAHNAWAYMDAFTNTATGGVAGYDFGIKEGVRAGLVSTVGFVVPVSMLAAASEGKGWKPALLNVGYYFVALVVAGLLSVAGP